jgi:hypothetical protein
LFVAALASSLASPALLTLAADSINGRVLGAGAPISGSTDTL